MPQTEIINHYETLEVSADATLKDINSAYKRLALKHHPDKAVDGDVDKFQKIQQAAEILRDPYHRRKHDYELRAQRVRKAYAQGSERPAHGRGFYTKWMPSSIGSYAVGTGGYRYMYSYGNSVHMNPESKESREERERIEREKKIDEMLRRRKYYGEEVVEQSENFEKEVKESPEEKEVRHQEAMRARVVRDEDELDDGEGPGEEGKGKEERVGAEEEEYGEEQEVVEEAAEEQQVESGVADEGVPESHENEGNGDEDIYSSDFSDAVSTSEYGTAQESEILHSDAEDDGSNHKPTIEEEEITVFYDCAERNLSRVNNAETVDTDSSEDESETSDEEDIEQKDNHGNSCNYSYTTNSPASLLTPFIPHFMAKLNDPSGNYTEDDLKTELQGIVMETYCGWLEGLRVTFSGAKPQHSLTASDTAGYDNKQECLHLGYWKKEFERPECDVCHRWKPIFTLTCPGCGIKACVGCKFQG